MRGLTFFLDSSGLLVWLSAANKRKQLFREKGNTDDIF